MAGGGKAHLRDPETVLIRAEDLVVEFPLGRGRVVKAVSGISLDVKPVSYTHLTLPTICSV